MRRPRLRLFKLICLVIVAGSGLFLRLQFGEVAARQSGAVNFERDIRPLLHARCVECHGPEKQQAGLRLDIKTSALKGAVIIPGKSSESELIRRVSSVDPTERMPSKGDPLTPRAKSPCCARGLMPEQLGRKLKSHPVAKRNAPRKQPGGRCNRWPMLRRLRRQMSSPLGQIRRLIGSFSPSWPNAV